MLFDVHRSVSGSARAGRSAATAILVSGLLTLASGCSVLGGASVPIDVEENLVKGPAVAEIVTPFDRALSCLDGRINKEVLRFSVGSILDSTGKEQLSEGGASKFVTQGAGDIVQSALFRAGVIVVNRRDPRVMEAEAKWGIRDTKSQLSSTFYITGSINSLDFLPGGGLEAQIAGVGPRYRKHRMLIGLDLSLTETRTGRILANIPLQKQIVATEDGFGIGRFFGETLVSLDLGHNKREAIHFALRQMLNLATFELLTQMMKPEQYVDCYEMIETIDGVLGESRSSKKIADYRAAKSSAAASAKDAEKAKDLAKATNSGEASNPEADAAADGTSPDAGSAAGDTPVETPPTAPAPVPTAAPAAQPGADEAYFTDESADHDQTALNVLELRRAAPPADPVVTRNGVSPPANGNGGGTSSVKAENESQGKRPDVSSNVAANCAPLAGTGFPQVTPLLARKAGTELRIASDTPAIVCITDANGKTQALTLQPGSQQDVVGQAPWRLQSDQLRKLRLEFQGYPLRVPSYVKDRMELQERR